MRANIHRKKKLKKSKPYDFLSNQTKSQNSSAVAMAWARCLGRVTQAARDPGRARCLGSSGFFFFFFVLL